MISLHHRLRLRDRTVKVKQSRKNTLQHTFTWDADVAAVWDADVAAVWDADVAAA